MKISMISLGCAKNRVVSEQMLYKLSEAGHEIVEDENLADIIIVNTCAFIEEAQQEAVNTLLQTATLKETGNLKKLIATGCLSEIFREEIIKEIPEVDAVVGAASCLDIAEVVEKLQTQQAVCLFAEHGKKADESPRIISTGRAWTYLLIADGCDNFCSYCLIPKIRGRFRSREKESILAEAKALAERGYKELILVAQDLTHYGYDLYGKTELSDLLRKLCEIDGIEWIRLHYLYPQEIDDELIKTVKEEKKIVKYLDIPIQHINDEVLKKCNRRDTGAKIRELFSRIREEIPNVVLRTSLIAGLPGEGEEEFEELCEFLREYKIERAGVFTFSPQDGTPAAKMEHVSEDTARIRANIIMDIQAEIMDSWESSLIGKVIDVICESNADVNGNHHGRAYFDSPEVDGSVLFTGKCKEGDIVKIEVTSAEDGQLRGKMI